MIRSTSSRRGMGKLAVALVIVGVSVGAREQAAGVGPSTTIRGCLVPEADYALARGLAREAPVAASSRDVQLVLITGQASLEMPPGDGYVLTGRLERSLAGDVGRQVELSGVLEESSPSAAPDAGAEARDLTPDGAAGTTSSGSPAHEPPDATGGIRPDLQRAGVPARSATSRPASIGELPRLNVTGSRTAGGQCGLAPVTVSSPIVSPASGSSASLPSNGFRDDDSLVTIVGCLTRQESDGRTELILTGAPSASASSGRTSAVPGSLPSGTDSGTVGTSGGSRLATIEQRAYVVQGGVDVSTFLGRRLEIVGILSGTIPSNSPASRTAVSSATVAAAHPSAPEQRIVVRSARVTGVCR